jgi:penicillin amidase
LADSLPSPDERPQSESEAGFSGIEMSPWSQVVNALLLLILASVSVAFVWIMSSLPRIDGPVPVGGLELPVQVSRDAVGIPRISARSLRDAYFSIGWIHAQDRMWQMELQRRVGAGRLAELVGPAAIDSDRFMRTLGLYRLAAASLDKLDRPTRDALGAYADGVNSWIAAHRHRLPPEFLLLGSEPEPWSPADSLVWGRMMAMQLAGDWRDELLRSKLAGKLDSRRLNELWPDASSDGPTTLAAGLAESVLAAIPSPVLPRQASNVWALSGALTASGKPLLANDPHLPFQAPGQWYLMKVDAPGLMLAGATIPGVPFHLIGHNGRIAWGMTTTHADTVDLVIERINADGTYQTGKTARPFTRRDEIIHVKGGAAVILPIRESIHGPIISDVINKDDLPAGQALALRATALEPDDLTAQALLKMGHAIDWRGFTAALRDFHSPTLNLMYADTEGSIGFFTAGRIPRRKSGDGTRPAEGWTDRGDWVGWIPFDKLPQSLNPKSQMLVNANNRVVPDRYPFLITANWPDGSRAERIGQLLNNRKGLTVPDMAAIQTDEISLPALELKELFGTPETGTPRAAEAIRMLAAWNGRMDAERPEPLIFSAWADEVWTGIFADDLGRDLSLFRSLRPAVLADALTRNRHWCDDSRTPEPESCEQQVAQALERAVQTLSHRFGTSLVSWRWGDAHQAVFDHPILAGIPVLSRVARTELRTGGDNFTVNRGTFVPGQFRHVHGPGLRVVFDLSDLSASTFVLAVGQAGNPLSRHYDDQSRAWQSGRGFVIGQTIGHPARLELIPSY